MSDIHEYNNSLEESHKATAIELQKVIERTIPKAEGKVWHGHPVWFLEGNPLVGYSVKKSGMELLFWSGKSFTKPGLTPVGNYQAAGVNGLTPGSLDENPIEAWLQEAVKIQWDYQNLPKNRGLVKLTNF